jgi:hypothetical protein
MKGWLHPLVAVLLVGCADEPKATKFRGLYLGQTLDEMNAALASERTDFKALEQGDPNEVQIVKIKTGQVCGHRYHIKDLEWEWLALEACFFDLPEKIPLQDLKAHIASMTGIALQSQGEDYVGISPFGERINVTAVIYPSVVIDRPQGP